MQLIYNVVLISKAKAGDSSKGFIDCVLLLLTVYSLEENRWWGVYQT